MEQNKATELNRYEKTEEDEMVRVIMGDGAMDEELERRVFEMKFC